jgi:DNA-binding CsgD family transcriptional regulator
MSYNSWDPTLAIDYANEAIAVCDTHGFAATAAKSVASLALAYWERGEMFSTLAALEEAIARSDACGDAFAGLHARYLYAPALAHAARYDEALSAAAELEARSRDVGTHLFDGFPEVTRGLVALHAGHAEESVSLLTAAAQVHPSPYGGIFILGNLADAHFAAGQFDKAERQACEVRDTAESLRIGSSSAFVRHLLARLERARDNLVRAEEQASEGVGIAHNFHNVAEVAENLEVLAGIATDLESYDEAARLFGAARAVREASGYQYCVNEREEDLVRLCDALGSGRVDELLGDGARLSVDEAVGYALRGRGTRRRPSTGWASLSPVEGQVVSLVREGLTNGEIGTRLFISPRTVQAHLTHVFSKLGIASRTELATEAVRRGV